MDKSFKYSSILLAGGVCLLSVLGDYLFERTGSMSNNVKHLIILLILISYSTSSCVPLSRYEEQGGELLSLEEKYTNLEDSYNSLVNKYNALIVEYDNLVENYNKLVEQRNQFDYRAINHRYGYNEYNYSFTVRSGHVTWTYKCPDGNYAGSFGIGGNSESTSSQMGSGGGGGGYYGGGAGGSTLSQGAGQGGGRRFIIYIRT